jgi:hypothetical protein
MPPASPTPPIRDELVLSPGMGLLVRTLFALPRPAGWHVRGLQELNDVIPSPVLENVAEEVLASFDHREIEARPTVVEIRAMAFAAMAMRHHLGSVFVAKKPGPSRFRRGRSSPPEKR